VIIALLALLGVSLWAILALVALVITRRRWIKRQPGAFHCAARRIEGETPRVGRRRWRRGWGRRTGAVFVWDPTPGLVGSSLLRAVNVGDSRPAEPGEIRRMGDAPAIVEVTLSDGATIAVAVRDEDAARSLRG
jgi:hypothetical protein